MNNQQIPVSYDYIMQYNAQKQPSTTHVTDTYQARFFQRYLLQEFMSLFDFDIPEEWDIDYFKYTLFLWGFLVIFDTHHCQQTSLFTNPELKILSSIY